ncbi:MAG: leucine-rich repeat protein [Clostridia bacterium]|nr:leucine-rich repeat protein [Clostridia bacterium]
MKRFISFFLSVCLVITTLVAGVVTVYAEGTPIEDTGITWSFDEETGTLHFDGEGAIPDFDEYMVDDVLTLPWKDCAFTTVTFAEGITGIGNYAFCYSESLKTIEIPDTVTILGKGVFFRCTVLESVVLPSEITEIGENTFSNCMALTSVTFGEKVEAIGTKAFYRCSALEDITLPASLKTIGNNAFDRCTALTGIDIPEGVTAIGSRAFNVCEDLEEVTLPTTLETIGEGAFNECLVLKAIEIPEKITTIPAELFYNCRALESVTLPDGLCEIQTNAFYLCNKLAGISIPAKVNIIGEKALGYGKYGNPISGFTVTGYQNSVARLYADANEFNFVSLGYILNGTCGETATWEYNEEEKTLYISGSGAMEDFSANPPAIHNLIDYEKVVIGEEITRIGAYAFYGAAAMDFEISLNVTEIGEKAIGYYVDEEGNEAVREGTSITAYEETAAQAYATENGITFNTLGKLLVTSGVCGDAAGWTYDEETKTLTISGTGAIYDYTEEALPEFAEYEIDSIIIGDDITAIGDFAFCTTKAYNEITVGKDVFEIGYNSFGFTKTYLTDEEGNPTEEIAYIPNNELIVKGYIVTPADEYAREFEFIFEALDADTYTEFSFLFPTVTDHINKFIFTYVNNANDLDFNPMVEDPEVEVTLPEKLVTNSAITLTKGEAENTYTFIVYGDVNCDGKSNSTDALAILQHSVMVNVVEDAGILAASDINHDGKVNSTDALIILQLSVGKSQITDYYNPGLIR